MDGGTRKRRLEGEDEGEEDSEEQKMEKFFALIRSTKEVRDRISKGRESDDKRLEEGKFKNVWNTAFQPEDFFHDYRDSGVRSTHPPGPSNDNRDVHVQDKGSDPIAEAPPPPPAPSPDEEANEEEDKLDLNLSL